MSSTQQQQKQRRHSDATRVQSMFDIGDLRQALQRRWQNEKHRSAMQDRLKQLQDALVPRAVAVEENKKPSQRGAATASLPTAAAAASSSSTSMQQRRRLGNLDVAESTSSVLEEQILASLEQLKSILPATPWHDTIRFVTFDLPTNAKELEHWVALLVKGDENGEATKEAIFEAVPGMRNHPDTKVYLQDVVLPFRSFLMAQVVASVLRVDPKAGHHSSDSRGNSPPPSPSKSAAAAKQEAENEAEDRKSKRILPAQAHAAHHARDLDDVLYIDSLIPRKSNELFQHMDRSKKANVCTRYAAYHKIYLTTEESVDDSTWIEMMLPLAESGLAFAQHDVGLCYLSERKEQEGEKWLERAATLGHTRAMVELAKFYLADAMQWTQSSRNDDKNSSEKEVEGAGGLLGRVSSAAKLLPRRTSKTGVASSGGGTTAKERDAAFVTRRVKQAMKWLDTLDDSEWDVNTAKDKQEGKKLKEAIERDSQREVQYRRKLSLQAAADEKRGKRKQVYRLIITALCALLLAWWMAWSVPPRSSMTSASGGANPFDEELELQQQQQQDQQNDAATHARPFGPRR